MSHPRDRLSLGASRPQVGPQIPRAALARLLRDAEGLQELALAPCHEWLSDEDLVPVLARNPQLRSVALAGCGQLSRRALGALTEGCPRLQRLSLAHCDWVDGLALRGLADRCPALEELDLTACRQLKDEAIVYLAQRRGAGLRSLSLAVNANVGDTAVQELARNCPQLEHLDLTGCLRVGSDGVRCLGMGPVGWEVGSHSRGRRAGCTCQRPIRKTSEIPFRLESLQLKKNGGGTSEPRLTRRDVT